MSEEHSGIVHEHFDLSLDFGNCSKCYVVVNIYDSHIFVDSSAFVRPPSQCARYYVKSVSCNL